MGKVPAVCALPSRRRSVRGAWCAPLLLLLLALSPQAAAPARAGDCKGGGAACGAAAAGKAKDAPAAPAPTRGGGGGETDGDLPGGLGEYVWRQEAVAHIASLTARHTFCHSRPLEQEHCAESAREYEKAGPLREWAALEPGWDAILSAAELYEDASVLLQEGLVAEALGQLERSIALKLFPFRDPASLSRWQTHLATPGEGFRRVRLELADALTLAADCSLELAQGHGGGLAALVRAKVALEMAAELRSVEGDTGALDASSGYMRVLQSEILAAAVDALAQMRSRDVRGMLEHRGVDCRGCSNIRVLVRLALLLHLPPTASLPARARDAECKAAAAEEAKHGTGEAAVPPDSIRVRTLLGRAASFVSVEAYEALGVPCRSSSSSACTDGSSYVTDELLLCPPSAAGLLQGVHDSADDAAKDGSAAGTTRGRARGNARGGGGESPMVEMDLQELFGGVSDGAKAASSDGTGASAGSASATSSPLSSSEVGGGVASFSTLITKIEGDAGAEQEWAEILAEVIHWQNQHWASSGDRNALNTLRLESLRSGSPLDAFAFSFADADGVDGYADFVNGERMDDPSFDDARSELDRQLQEELSRQTLRDTYATERDGWEVPVTLALIGLGCSLLWLARKHRRQLNRFSLETLWHSLVGGGKAGDSRAGRAGAAGATAALRAALDAGDIGRVKRFLETAEKLADSGSGLSSVEAALLRRARTFLAERKRAEKALAEGKRREEAKKLESLQKKKLEEMRARAMPRTAPPPAPAATARRDHEAPAATFGAQDLLHVDLAKANLLGHAGEPESTDEWTLAMAQLAAEVQVLR